MFNIKNLKKKNDIHPSKKINEMNADQLLNTALMERQYTSAFQLFKNGFEKNTKAIIHSTPALDNYNNDFVDANIDSAVKAEKNNQCLHGMESIDRRVTAEKLESRAKFLVSVLEKDVELQNVNLSKLEGLIRENEDKYNRATYADPADYQHFEKLSSNATKSLKETLIMSPWVSALILFLLTLADSVNLFSLFQDIKMLQFWVLAIMVTISACCLELIPNFAGKIVANMKYPSKVDKIKKISLAALISIFVVLVIGLTFLRFTVLNQDVADVSDVTFSNAITETEESISEDTSEDTNIIEKAYNVFLTILLVCTSVVSFYLGYITGDTVLEEVFKAVEEYNEAHRYLSETETTIVQLKEYKASKLIEYDQEYIIAVLQQLDDEAVKLKTTARTLLYKAMKTPAQISYISDSAANIVAATSR